MVQLNILALVGLTHQFYQECGSASLICPRLRRFNRCLTFPSTQPAKLLSSVLARRCRRESRLWCPRSSCLPWTNGTKFSKKLNFPTVSECRCCELYLPQRWWCAKPSNLGKNQSIVVPGGIANQLTANLHRFCHENPW